MGSLRILQKTLLGFQKFHLNTKCRIKGDMNVGVQHFPPEFFDQMAPMACFDIKEGSIIYRRTIKEVKVNDIRLRLDGTQLS